MTPEEIGLLKKAEASQESGGQSPAARLLVREGFYDFAASRAYHAMFYAAEAALLAEDLSFSSHSAVIAAFGRQFAATERVQRALHRYLIEARDARHVADYEAALSLSEDDVATHVARAGEFLEVIRRLLLA